MLVSFSLIGAKWHYECDGKYLPRKILAVGLLVGNDAEFVLWVKVNYCLVGMSLMAHKQLNGMSMCLSTKLCNPIVWACRIIGADVQGKRSKISSFSLPILSVKFFYIHVCGHPE